VREIESEREREKTASRIIEIFATISIARESKYPDTFTIFKERSEREEFVHRSGSLANSARALAMTGKRDSAL